MGYRYLAHAFPAVAPSCSASLSYEWRSRGSVVSDRVNLSGIATTTLLRYVETKTVVGPSHISQNREPSTITGTVVRLSLIDCPPLKVEVWSPVI